MMNTGMSNGSPWPGAPRTTRQLDRDHALALLARVPVGRVAFTQNALPTIRTVGHVVDADLIVIRSYFGAAIVSHAAASGAVVAYEADDLDPEGRLRWSVVVTGIAHIIRNAELIARYERRLPAWTRGTADYFLSIHPTIVTGYALTESSTSNGTAGTARTDNA